MKSKDLQEVQVSALECETHSQQETRFRQQQHESHTQNVVWILQNKKTHAHVGTIRKATKTNLHNACFVERHLVAVADQKGATQTALSLLPPAGEFL